MAITRAQQAKQLLAQGGRIGFKNGPAGGASAGGNYGGNRNPEQTYGEGDKNPGLETNIDRFAIAEANQKTKAPLKKPKETKFQEFKRKFNPFPIATSILNKISKSKLARINNAMQRQNYINSLDLDDPEDKKEYDNIMSQLSGLGMDIIAGPGDLESTMLSVPPSMLATNPMTQFKTVDGVSTLADEGVKDVLGQGYEDYLNRFKTTENRDGPSDPCLGPNPPAYCFVGIRSVEPKVEEYVNPLSLLTPRIAGTQFAADGGRIGFKNGPAGGASAGGNYGGNRNPEQEYGGSIFTGGGGDGPKTTPTNVGGGNVTTLKTKKNIKTPSNFTKFDLKDLVNLYQDEEDDNMMLADLTDMQKKMLEGPQKNLKDIMGISNEEILQNIEKFNDPNAPATIQDIEEFYQQAKDGGLMSLNREAFLLGGIAKGLKKAVRGVKKLAKSPIGKAALLGAGFGLAGMGPMANLFSSGKGLAFKQLLLGGKTLPPSLGFKSKGLLGLIKANPIKSMLGASLLSGLMTAKQDDDEFDLASYYAQNQLTPSQSVRGMGSEFDFYGGPRMKVADGGNVEPVAKKTMPLLDMDGKEKDYRETGGFVDMGRMERADDVPARLSKNEFVFTADAVRNAGEGDIDKGAEVMYNMMKNLEAGGEVSEESQGLEGARKMFQTSQRLGEVI